MDVPWWKNESVRQVTMDAKIRGDFQLSLAWDIDQ